MSKQVLNYVLFLKNIIFSKKITWLSLIIFLLLDLIISISLNLLKIDFNGFSPLYINVFIQILFSIFYSSLIYISVFKELEEEGIEILSLSKSISRKNIFFGKTLFCLSFSLFYSLLFTIFNSIFALIFTYSLSWILVFALSLITFFTIFNFFGVISSLIAYKLNSKIAITIPYLVSIPAILGGIIVNYNSTSIPNNFAYYLNLKYDNNLSGKISNSEYFYLNNQKDNLYLVPNGYAKNEFSDKQKKFITQAYNKSKNSVNELAWYSYLVVPYQFLDIFNNNKTQHNKNNLDNYLNYNNSDSYLYNYKLDQNAKLFNYEKDQQKYYLIPSLLKNQTERENIVNTTLIYAREWADSFNLTFPEDTYVFSASDNLVGELKWKFLIDVLKDQNFNDYAKKLFAQVEAKIKNDELAYAKTKILEEIEKELNNSDSFLNRYQNSFVALFDEKMIENKTIKTPSEKKIYLAAALIYYVYFNLQDSKILESILWNNDNSTFEPHQLKVQIGDYKYNIGGYSAYTTMQEVREIDGEKNVVIRYNLDSNENYMFQNVTNVFELSRSNPIIIKETYFIIWILLISLLLTINGIKYTKKDYK